MPDNLNPGDLLINFESLEISAAPLISIESPADGLGDGSLPGTNEASINLLDSNLLDENPINDPFSLGLIANIQQPMLPQVKFEASPSQTSLFEKNEPTTTDGLVPIPNSPRASIMSVNSVKSTSPTRGATMRFQTISSPTSASTKARMNPVLLIG